MKYIIQADRLIDGSGSEPLKNGAVVTDGGKIIKVCTSDQLTQSDKNNAETLTVPGGSILPGFIEMHSHIPVSYTHLTLPTNREV